ncbi:hypothetical protein DFH08DRAFT_969068 [Mycena albidolilacea]|uniref:HNH nuclease domain-containing protein n=1 Tax=Mycena albidolilacea TaxID=1033008 RepID=A0AAD6ZI68_9AGAR|nr:hypothetical protein DFH08DRAFT_969068 [Mycena albidolilacea]
MPLLLPITPRPALTQPKLNTAAVVAVFHPRQVKGFPMLHFDIFPSTTDGAVGMPLGVVLDACFVVAGNHRGKLVHNTSPHHFVADYKSNQDTLLRPGYYNFVVVHEGGELDDNYGLCACFSAWTPPIAIPDRWKGEGKDAVTLARELPLMSGGSEVSAAVRTLDKSCIMSGAISGVQASHLVPEDEVDWWDDHYSEIKAYGGDDEDLTSIINEVAPRADLKMGLDQGLFLFAPYGLDKVIVVVIHAAASDIAYKFHLREVRFPARILRAYLFIRFAFTVFKSLAPGRRDTADAIAEARKRKSTSEGSEDAEDPRHGKRFKEGGGVTARDERKNTPSSDPDNGHG